jgi:hypothetical protein
MNKKGGLNRKPNLQLLEYLEYIAALWIQIPNFVEAETFRCEKIFP